MKVPEPRKLKSGNYFIQLRLNGVSIPVTTATAKECKRQAELIKAEHRTGKRVTQMDKNHLTLKQTLERYIENRRNVLSPATILGYEVILENRFQSVMKRPASEIKDWQAVINAEAKLCGAKTLKNAWGLVSASLKAGGHLVPEVALPQIIPATRPWLDAEQIQVFVKAVKGNPCEIPALLALHSLRRSEIIALTWERLDLEKGLIHIEGSAVPGPENTMVYKETNKSRNSRRIVPIMIPELKVALEMQEQRTGPVMKCHPNSLYKQINTVCKNAGLPAVGVHGLRHPYVKPATTKNLSNLREICRSSLDAAEYWRIPMTH